MFMKRFLNSILTLGLFILAAILFYIGISITFPTSLINIILFIVAIFVLLQGCGNIDKANGYGKYSATTSDDKDVQHQSKPQLNEEHLDEQKHDEDK